MHKKLIFLFKNYVLLKCSLNPFLIFYNNYNTEGISNIHEFWMTLHCQKHVSWSFNEMRNKAGIAICCSIALHSRFSNKLPYKVIFLTPSLNILTHNIPMWTINIQIHVFLKIIFYLNLKSAYEVEFVEFIWFGFLLHNHRIKRTGMWTIVKY